jgi:hypothetical protein
VDRAEQYEEWIVVNVNDPHNTCRQWAHAMVEWFPELAIARGWYVEPLLGRVEHWWCLTPSGTVIDPTAAQFPTGGEYEPVTDESQVPTGACLNCGDSVYEGLTCCSDGVRGRGATLLPLGRQDHSDGFHVTGR